MKTALLAALLASATHVAHADTGTPATAASAASDVDSTVAARRAADDAALNQAVQMIRAKQLQGAIDQILTPMITAKESEHPAASSPMLHCANSPNEALLYLVRAASEKKAAVVVDNSWCTALFMRGFAEIDLGQLNAAEIDFGRAVALSPNNPRYLSELAALHVRKHEWPLALALYQRALDAAPAFATPGRANAEMGVALRGIGYVDVEIGKLDEAESSYRRALEIDASDQRSRAELGYVQAQKAKAAAAK